MTEHPADPADDPEPPALRIAYGVVGLEALALLGLGLFLLVDTALGHTSHTARGLLSGVFALLGALALATGARGLRRRSVAARTPVVVLEVLALPVAYTMAFQADLPALGGPILIAALAVLYCLFTPPVRLIFDRQPRD